jgi:serine/threonine protein kinase
MAAVSAEKNDLFAQYQILEDLGDFPNYSLYKVKAPTGALKLWKKLDLQFNTAANETRLLPVAEKLHHPYVNAVTNSFMFPDKGLLFVESEFPAKTLRQRFQECRGQGGAPGIPVNELFSYIAQVAEGLDYLNAPNHPYQGRKIAVYHRGICPDTLHLFEEKGRMVCKVGDFGLAKPVLESAEAVRHSLGLTNYDFAPPEFDEGTVSSTSDQYSLATTYYNMRTGKLPFTGSLLSKLQSQLSGAVDLSAVDAAERPILARALSKEPTARFRTCREFVQQLQGALGSIVAVPIQPQRSSNAKAMEAFGSGSAAGLSASGRTGASLFSSNSGKAVNSPKAPEGLSLSTGSPATAKAVELGKTNGKKTEQKSSMPIAAAKGQEQQLSTLRIPTPKQAEGWKVESLSKSEPVTGAAAVPEVWTPGKVTSGQTQADPLTDPPPLKAEHKAEMLSPKGRETLELIKKRQAQAANVGNASVGERSTSSGTRLVNPSGFGKSTESSPSGMKAAVSAAPAVHRAAPALGKVAPGAKIEPLKHTPKKSSSQAGLAAPTKPVPELRVQPAPSTEVPKISWMTIVMVAVAAFCMGLLIIVYFSRQVPK